MKYFKFNDYVATAFILLLVFLLAYTTHVLSRVDYLFYDIGQKFFNKPVPSDVIIVAVDEDSLSQLGRWPWPRDQHADLIKKLKDDGANVIGLDIIFSEPDLKKGTDTALAMAMQQAGNVVLPVLLESTRLNGQVLESLPIPSLIDYAADLGRVHVHLDEDGIARSIYQFEGVGAPVWQHFSQAVLNVAQKQPSKNQLQAVASTNEIEAPNSMVLVRNNLKKVNFLGAAGHFKTISYVQVIKGEFEKGLFKDKIVLVGATALGLGDVFPTPVSSASRLMPGVEFHANALESIRHNKLISTPSKRYALPILAVIALLPLLWLPRLSALNGLLFTLFAFVALGMGAIMLPQMTQTWLPPAAALSAILISYPVWSWRKLEAARKYLDHELNYLKSNLIDLPAAKQTNHFDSFDARIDQVRAASQQLRFLQNDRKEMLAFISHDLRAPIANALMFIEENNLQQPRLRASLSQAHTLAEDFLHSSRAEMIDITKFKDLDLASLTHQAVDDAFEAARKKNIILIREIVQGAVWLQGNFGLLQRAIVNLILNAIKFAPSSSEVKIILSLQGMQAVVHVINSGKGIAKADQIFLFKRFSRMSTSEHGVEGAGLGLYFVQTVAEKHRGYATVESDTDADTCFSMHLPITSFRADTVQTPDEAIN